MSIAEKSGIGRFKGEGFDYWKFRVELFLTKNQVEDCLTKVFPTDATEATAFKAKDDNAKHLLVSLIDDSFLEVVRDKKTAKEMWTALNTTFAKSGAVSQHILRRQLNNIRMDPGETMKQFFNRFDEIVRELRASGAKLDDADIRSSLTINLPESYDPLVTALENIDNLTIDVMKARLLAEEEKKIARENRSNESSSSSNAMFGKGKGAKLFDKTKITCYGCGKKGHFKNECSEEKIEESVKMAKVSKGRTTLALSAISRNKRDDWILDSGASHHMTSNLKNLSNVKKFKEPIQITVAKKDEVIYATHEGDLHGYMFAGRKKNRVRLEKVWFVPELQSNLLSVKAIDKKGISVLFENQSATIKDSDGVYGQADLSETGLYSIEIEPIKEQVNLCSGTRRVTTRPLERIHSDVKGPISPVAYDGARYFVTFVDDYTNFSYIYTISGKYQVFECFKEYQAIAEARFNTKIGALIVNGSEYLSNVQRKYCKQKGIVVETEKNCAAERMNQTIVEKARAMLNDVNAPEKLWSEAVSAAVYVINRSPTSALKMKKTPAELWYSEKPD